jgi:hypothetical protein
LIVRITRWVSPAACNTILALLGTLRLPSDNYTLRRGLLSHAHSSLSAASSSDSRRLKPTAPPRMLTIPPSETPVFCDGLRQVCTPGHGVQGASRSARGGAPSGISTPPYSTICVGSRTRSGHVSAPQARAQPRQPPPTVTPTAPHTAGHAGENASAAATWLRRPS